MYSSSNNNVSALIDEIALEGLDGITLEALWTRLDERPTFVCTLNDHSKSYFWNIVRRLRDVEMFALQEPRPPLIIFNRYNYVDPELGMVLEPNMIPEDIYPHCPVEDPKKKVRGSCSTYYQRRNVGRVARKLSYQEALEKWGTKLVIVAKQDARNSALMGLNCNPHLDLTIMQYCVLERIGRSRYMGEVTQGKVSLQVVVDDPKALFYHRKFLMRHKLVVKQVHHQKSGSQNCTGSLMHLPRFRVERKPKALFLTEKVIEILKTRPNYIAEYEEIRKELGLANSLKKLFKTLEFQRYVRTDLRLPYRSLYPAASVAEWKHKGNDKEKRIRAVQLINPDMDVREIWTKDDDLEEEDETPTGILDQKDLLLDRSILSQAFRVIENAGPEGLSQMELSSRMGVSKLQSRTLCRNLLRKGAVATYMNDVGRQRVFRYMSKKFQKEGKMSIEFMREKNKMLKLVGKKKQKIKLKPPNNESGTVENMQESGLKRPHEEEDKEESPVAKKAKTEKESIVTEEERPLPGTSEETQNLVEHNIETEVLEVMMGVPGVKDYQASFTEELMKIKSSSKETPSPNITYRILRRANMIIEAVRAHKVIDDLTKLMKHINEEEDKEGYNVKIDKKSLLRLLVKLSKDGHIKVIKIVLKGGDKEKMLSFVCEPYITTDHTIIQSAVEQAKMKFFILGKDRVTKLCAENSQKEKEDDTFSSDLINKSMKELKSITSKDSKLKSTDFVYDSKIGKKYGFSPKFVRMQIMHQFLFYLIYKYTGNESLDQQAVINRLRERDLSITDEVVEEMAQIYSEEVGWKMFIPPLPNHAGWPTGWAIMCDLLLRLPLCIFVKVFNVTFVIPDLEEYLNHPIRKNYLVKHLPTRLRNALMVARRYIFSIHEVMQRLCYIGLIQFGPQRLKEKDQVFVYLNCKTTLLDTTTSKPGYHQVSDDIQYVEHKYEFHSLSDVEKYWYEMWNFCIHTQLGGRMHVTGKDIVLEVLQNKQVMIEAILPRQPLEAPLLDIGEVPGDKRGAAGLDSAFFSHLKRNWNWTNNTVGVTSSTSSVPAMKPKVVEQRKARLASLKPEPINLGEIFQKNPKKATKSTSPFVKKKVSRKAEPKKNVMVEVPKASRKKKKNVIRHVLPRKIKKTHRPYYDEVDMKALQLMSKLRVEWSTTEDNLLLLCKVASMYLCPNPRKQVINFQMIRDILHNICPASSNKTSRACQRRILYMMKNPATAHSVALHLEDVRQDPNIIKQFKNTIQELRSKTDDSEQLEKMAAEKFKVLVNVLQRKFNPQPSDYNVLHRVLPETLSEFRKQYEVVYPSSTLKRRGRFQDVKNVVDIYCAVVNAIIHSSLCCVSDKTSYTYQLFQVYQQYPDNLLRSAMAKIRGDQMVSLKKSYLRLKQKTGNYLPVSSSPYQLSISYVHQLQTRYQYEIFYDSHLMSKKLCEWYFCPPSNSTGLEAAVTNGGTAAALVELFTRRQMTFDVEIPEQVIILDPRVSEKDETYARIVQRYRDILRSYKTGKDMATSSVLFKKPFMDFEEINKDCDLALGSRDPDGDPDFGDAEFMEADNTEDADDQTSSTNQQTAIARAASRIALYMMREELGDAMVGEKQHAHDFFVVNSCKVFCRVSEPPGTKTTNQGNELIKMDIEQKKDPSQNLDEQMQLDPDHCKQALVSRNEKDMVSSVLTKQALLSENEKDMVSSDLTEDPSQNVGEQMQVDQDHCKQALVSGNEKDMVFSDLTKQALLSGNEKDMVSSDLTEDPSQNVDEQMQVDQDHCKEALMSGNEKDMVSSDLTMQALMSENDKDIVSSDSDLTKQALMSENDQDIVSSDSDLTKQALMSENEKDIVSSDLTNQALLSENEKNMVSSDLTALRQNIESNRDPVSGTANVNITAEVSNDQDVDHNNSVRNESTDAQCHSSKRDINTPLEKNVDQFPPIVGHSGNVITKVSLDTENERLNARIENESFFVRSSGESEIISVDQDSDAEGSLEIETQTTSDNAVQNSSDEQNGQRDNSTDPATPVDTFPWRVSNTLLPLTQERIKEVLKEIESCTIVSDEPVHEEDVYALFLDEGACDADWKKVLDILDFAKRKKEIGATMKELRKNFCNSSCPMPLATILQLLTISRILYRSGVTTIHYIFHLYTKPWLVHSYKLMRHEREKQLPPPQSSVMNMPESCDPQGKQSDKAHDRIRAWRRRRLLAAAKEVERAVQTLDLSGSERIHVAIRPWVRVDGSVNRRVLDRLLGAVLGHCMYTPGGSIKGVADHFTPALQPYQVRELIEILQKLGCVTLSVVKQSCRTTLLSKPSTVKISPADGTEDESKIAVDPQPDAVLRLGQFIGDKAYSRDFLSLSS